MEIRISEKEINAGVVAYLNSRGFNLDPNTVKIDYTQGRKPAGLTAVLVEAGFDSVEQEPEPQNTKPVQVLTGQADPATAPISGDNATADPAPEVVTEALVADKPADTDVSDVEVGVIASENTEAPATTSLFQ